MACSQAQGGRSPAAPTAFVHALPRHLLRANNPATGTSAQPSRPWPTLCRQVLLHGAAPGCRVPVYSASRSPSTRSSNRTVLSMQAASTQLWSLLTAAWQLGELAIGQA